MTSGMGAFYCMGARSRHQPQQLSACGSYRNTYKLQTSAQATIKWPKCTETFFKKIDKCHLLFKQFNYPFSSGVSVVPASPCTHTTIFRKVRTSAVEHFRRGRNVPRCSEMCRGVSVLMCRGFLFLIGHAVHCLMCRQFFLMRQRLFYNARSHFYL